MDKLTIKELSAYLPYGLKFISEMDVPYGEYKNNPIWTLGGISNVFGCCLLTLERDDAYLINLCKPILRPLSDLTKEIEVNRYKFVPLIKLAKRDADLSGYNNEIRIFKGKCYCFSKSSELEFRFNGADFTFDKRIVGNQYSLMQKLFEWHFDVFGLIEKGLAIDINTLNK